MSEWKEVKLGMLGNIITGKTPRTAIEDNYGGTIPFLTPSDDMSVKHVVFTKKTLSEKGVAEVKNCLLPCGAVCVSCIGSDLGKVVITTGDTITNQQINSIIVNENNNNDFVYYLLTIVGRELNRISKTSTAVPIINKSTFSSYEIKIPDLFTQQEIAGILSSLDAKIETNNKLNEKLEEMAQAIFKSWFVDFEPFKDKPFHETELGMIPEGWEVSTFSSIIEKLISGDWGKETPTGNYVHKVACIRGCDFENIKNGLRGKTPERFILERNFALKQPKPNDIVVEMSGGTATVSTGRICYITKELLDQYEGDIVCTNFCKIVRPLKGWSQYLYYYWQYKYDKKVMFCYENGTSGIKNFAINDFIDFESILIPPKDELIKFNSIIDNIRVKIQMNGVENTRLASLRDTLLPRLMSGELIV